MLPTLFTNRAVSKQNSAGASRSGRISPRWAKITVMFEALFHGDLTNVSSLLNSAFRVEWSTSWSNPVSDLVLLHQLHYSSGPVIESRSAGLANSSSSNGRAGSFEVLGINRHRSRSLFDSAWVSLATPISTSQEPPKNANRKLKDSSRGKS